MIKATKAEEDWCNRLKSLIEEQPEGLTIESPIVVSLYRINGNFAETRPYYVVTPNSAKYKNPAPKK